MSDEPISERVSRLAGEALSAQARIVRESVEVGRDAWQPGTDPTALSKAWAELATAEGQRYWQSLATIGLDTTRELLALNTRTAAAFLRGLSEATGPRRYAAPPPSAPPPSAPPTSAPPTSAPPPSDARDGDGHRHPDPHGSSATRDDGPAERPDGAGGSGGGSAEPAGAAGVVRLTGPSGSTARGSLTVANRHPRARRVTVTANELRDAATGEATTAVLVIDPQGVTVPAGEERRVELAIELDPAAIRPGRAYAATLQISGGDEARVEVVVTADPA